MGPLLKETFGVEDSRWAEGGWWRRLVSHAGGACLQTLEGHSTGECTFTGEALPNPEEFPYMKYKLCCGLSFS